MTSEDRKTSASLNEFQVRGLTVTCQYVDKVIGEIEQILHSAASKAAFPRYIEDVTPTQRRTIEDYLARIRAQLARVLDGQGIPRPEAWVPTSRAVYTALTTIDIALEELRPQYMKGYGELTPELAMELEGISGELRGLVERLNRYLMQDAGQDLRQRLQRLEQTSGELELLGKIERVVTQRGLVEFRSTIAGITDRLEDQSLEIAVFGRVSSGKSTLLNVILGEEILPVGVTPITAVPTRIRYGEMPQLTVWFAERRLPETLDIGRLAEVASEKGNPQNQKRVTRIIVDLPSSRLRKGTTFVDTPGLGSLATSGASETLAYLPNCDLGLVLIDAGSTLTQEDLQTIQALQDASIPVQVLLSKADLLTPQEVDDMIRYVKENIVKQCSIEVPVYAVSAIAKHRELLTRWFEAEILPLYQRSQDLKSLSVKRKVGTLRDAVVAALSTRVRRSKGISSTDSGEIREVEARLRRATGRIPQLQNELERDIRAFSRDTGWLIERAADQLAQEWRRGKDSSTGSGLVVYESIVGDVHQQAKVYRQHLESLASDLHAELKNAEKVLGLPHGPTEEEFTSAIRSMPAFDFAGRDLKFAPAFWGRLLGKVGLRIAARRAIRSKLDSYLSNVVSIYGGVFKDWSSSVVNVLARRFANYADSYRAQAERAQSSSSVGAEEVQALLTDLRALGGEVTVTEAGLPVVADEFWPAQTHEGKNR
jgi:GTP-binding protein EngB required for normal cell division